MQGLPPPWASDHHAAPRGYHRLAAAMLCAMLCDKPDLLEQARKVMARRIIDAPVLVKDPESSAPPAGHGLLPSTSLLPGTAPHRATTFPATSTRIGGSLPAPPAATAATAGAGGAGAPLARHQPPLQPGGQPPLGSQGFAAIGVGGIGFMQPVGGMSSQPTGGGVAGGSAAASPPEPGVASAAEEEPEEYELVFESVSFTPAAESPLVR